MGSPPAHSDDYDVMNKHFPTLASAGVVLFFLYRFYVVSPGIFQSQLQRQGK